MNRYSPEKSLKPVISLLGVSGSGKSTVAQEVTSRLSEDGLRSAIIKKDDAIRLFGSGRKNEGLGYIQGNSNETAVLGLMNLWLRQTLENVDVAFLEGGTRTPDARKITMSNTEHEARLTIVRFDVSALNVARRLRERRHQEDRADDNMFIMAGKLAGQLYKDWANRGQTFDDVNYEVIDANRPLDEVASEVEAIVHKQLP